MTEISKNTPNIPQQPQKIEQVKQEPVQEVAQQPAEVPTKEITEIPENPADRSAVKIDNIENDLKVFASNPELTEKAMAIAELAEKKYADAGVKDPELKALAVSKAFVEEFQK